MSEAPFSFLTVKCLIKNCEKSFSSKSALQKHIGTSHNGVCFKCDKCAKSYTAKFTLDLHIKSSHYGVKYKCPIEGCEKFYTDKTSISKHVHAVHDEIRYSCEHDGCSSVFTRKDHLLHHIESSHDNRKFVCNVDICKKSYSYEVHLLHHIKTFHNGFRYACKFEGCERVFIQRPHLKQHLEGFHLGIKYACAVCGEQYSKSYMTKHISISHENIYNASRCKQEVVIKNLLRNEGLEFKSQHYINLGCAIPESDTIKAFGDILLLFHNTVVIVEVDEEQHSAYGVSCDVQRMAKIIESLRLDGNTQRIVFIRYNPHAFTVDGFKQKRVSKDRHKKLVDLLRVLENEPLEDAQDVRTFYLFYDTDKDGFPDIFSDITYDELAKQWFVESFI